MDMDVIGKRKIFLGISGSLVLLSLVLIGVFGLKQGIDLVGGTNWQMKFDPPAGGSLKEAELRSYLAEISGWANVSVRGLGGNEFLAKLPVISEEQHQLFAGKLREKFGNLQEEKFESIGPTIGSSLRKRIFTALGLVLGGISLYVIFAFRQLSKPVQSWKYGLITVLTLVHDVIIPIGALAFLGWWKGIEIETVSLVALLVVMGYSVHDTIVVFDRIRENILSAKNPNQKLSEVINRSVRETVGRSLNTSLTTIFALLALLFLGPESLRYFVLVISIGLIVGTYSSIFLASPLLYVISRKKD